MKQITYQPAAIKALKKMAKNVRERITGKIEQYAEDPSSLANNVTNLKGRDGIRLVVGDYRVIMLDDDVLDVLEVGLRGGIYTKQEADMSDVIEITRAEYEALLADHEDLADIRRFDAAMERHVPGLPAEVAHKIMGGENSLKAIRKWRGLTQTELAAASGVLQVTISQIETGKITGSLESFKNLASALNVAVDFLIDT